MYKDIIFDDVAREKVKEGVKTIAKAVKSTLGPSGKNVLISRAFMDPVVTKDGVSVANAIEIRDHLVNAGAQMVRAVASRTSTDAGDGTTTATVLAEAIYEAGLKAVIAGESPIAIKRGIEKAVSLVVEKLEQERVLISDKKEIEHIGTIASNNDEKIGQLLAEAMDKVGKDGVISIEESSRLNTEIEYSEGMQFDKGYISPYLHAGNQSSSYKINFEDCLLLLHEGRIESLKGWENFLSQIAGTQKPLLIICSDMGDGPQRVIYENNRRNSLRAMVVKAPGFGQRKKDILEDIAALTGGRALLSEAGIKPEEMTIDMLGEAARVVITRENTMIVGGKADEGRVTERIKGIREELEHTQSEFDREKLQERLAKLTGGVARILVGGKTEIEMKEKKDRIEDALHAVRAGVEEGILPGGGTALAKCIDYLRHFVEQEKTTSVDVTGMRIVLDSLSAPLKQIADNAGQKPDIILNNVVSKEGFSVGYNALTDTYENLIESGVIDPLKVTKCALTNAASVSTLLLTTDVMIVERPEDAKDLLETMQQGS